AASGVRGEASSGDGCGDGGSEGMGCGPRLGGRGARGGGLKGLVACRVALLAGLRGEGGDGDPLSAGEVLLLEQALQRVQVGVDVGQPGVARGKQWLQEAEQGAGGLDAGGRARERGPAAVVVVPGELELQGVLDLLVGTPSEVAQRYLLRWPPGEQSVHV